MTVFLNGRFVPEAEAVVSIFDRGFLYGDGLFETIRVINGKPFRWTQHIARLQRGAEFLKIKAPYCAGQLTSFANDLLARNKMRDALLRLQLSRGVGPRGYSPNGADSPMLVMTLHDAPAVDLERAAQWKLTTASLHLPANDALASFKTCNKLPHILARAEAEASGADEALLLNTDDEAAQAASGNLFWVDEGRVCTPPLEGGVLAGVTRAVVLEIGQQLGLRTQETGVIPEALQQMQGVFLSLSSWGIVEVVTLDNHGLSQSPIVQKIHAAYQGLVRRECA